MRGYSTIAFANDHGWGVVKDGCQQIEVIEGKAFSGQKSISVQWDNVTQKCSLVVFGVNWSQWKPIDMRKVSPDAVLSFAVQSDELDKLSFRIDLEDFFRLSMGTDWKKEYVTGKKGNWSLVEIPLRDFKGNANPADIKSLVFRLEGSGNMLMDQIMWKQK
ncbi:MAG: hypothetical protein AAF206_08165 [Bacteroidota bacterium]